MPEKPATENQEPSADRPVVDEKDKAKARKWFARAGEVADTRNYDYAIECFINGLELWPEAVEEGHRPLWAVALQRRSSGGKKAGLAGSIRLHSNTRDPKRNMLNAEMLLAKDPASLGNMHNFVRCANKGGFDRTMQWMGPIYLQQLSQEKKPSESRLKEFAELFEDLGSRCQGYDDYLEAVAAYELALKAAEQLGRMKPHDMATSVLVKDVSSRLAIIKGKFDTGGDFRESLQDAEAQRDLHDVDRLVQAEARVDQLIAAARKDYEANPHIASKLMHLVELMCRREVDRQESEAVELLEKGYADSGNYQLKQRADDIRLKQSARRVRAVKEKLKADLKNVELREQAKKVIDSARRMKMKIFEERVAEYPTNLRVRFSYAECLMEAKRYDQAIPEFQAAQADPRNRLACKGNIGRCFFFKQYHDQAIAVFREAISEVEIAGDATSKDLHYWLGRSLEASDERGEAMKVYGQVLQWDYNFRDVRERMDALREAGTQME